MKVVIIDSGTDNQTAEGIHFFYNGEQIDSDSDIKDVSGHGTAIHNIIKKHNEKTEFFIVKIFDSEDSDVDEKLLFHALEYVYKNVECQVINLSLGIRVCENELYMKNLCKRFLDKGVSLVAAFDNEGAVSYPALFEEVIGVISSECCTSSNQYIFVNNPIINVSAYGSLQRVKWVHGNYNMVQGNSFACAHVSGVLTNCDKELNYSSAMEYLRSNSMKCLDMGNTHFDDTYRNQVGIKINRAAVFPFNKEIHSLLMFQDLLTFEIDGVYETRYSFFVGAETDKVLKRKCTKNFVIENVSNIRWDNIDTLIVGHIDKLISMTQNRNYFSRILMEANKREKFIYSFDELDEMFPEIFFRNLFCVSKLDRARDVILPNGMLYCQSRPVVEVCGTSSRQGKFTLQLILRRLFLQHGYKVGQLGTEPTALLFGMDEIFHCGHNNSICLNSYQVAALLNKKMHAIERKEPDIIITGAQGNMLMENPNNLRYYTFSQTEFLLGTMPDAIILCVNTFDEIEEIRRYVSYLESVIYAKVVAVVIFPTKIVNDKLGNPELVNLRREEFVRQKENLQGLISKRVFILGEEEDMEQLYDVVVEFFSD